MIKHTIKCDIAKRQKRLVDFKCKQKLPNIFFYKIYREKVAFLKLIKLFMNSRQGIIQKSTND